MTRLIAAAAALASAATLFGAAAATAQQPGYYYVATPAGEAGKPSFVARETVWNWQNGAYVARRGGDRDAVQCELVARRAGKLASFTAGGAAFDADALDRCNAKAR